MPLVFTRQTDLVQMAVWNKTESVEQLLPIARLDALDEAEYVCLSNARRQTEWLATRVLLDQMLGNHVHLSHATSGKPYLLNDSRFVSISHSPNMVAVMVSERNLGIDIERIHARTVKVRGKFLTGSEPDWCTTEEEHTLVWTVKEAAYKLVDDQLLHTEVEVLERPVIKPEFSFDIVIKKNGLLKMICNSMKIDDNILSYLVG